MNGSRKYEYDAILHEDPDSGGAYVIFPWDLRKEFGKGRVRVYAEFDGIPYDGSIVNMGVKSPDGNICYIIGVLKRFPMVQKTDDTKKQVRSSLTCLCFLQIVYLKNEIIVSISPSP